MTDDVTPPKGKTKKSTYAQVFEHIFAKYHTDGASEVAFTREDIVEAAEALGLNRPKNLGNVVYSFRYRREFPDSITRHAPEGKVWIIRGKGRAEYVFALANEGRILPNGNLVVTKVPDATPEIIRANKLDDEQALLALVRYNRLIDIFLGVTAYSMQNHLRTYVKKVGQVEVDEVYLAVDRYGVQYILPTQAKGGKDQIGIVQIEQDLAMCRGNFPELVARPIAAQFMGSVIALFELAVQDDNVVVVAEAHYELVPNDEITENDRAIYRTQAGLPPAL